jgi:hypothetical protein
LRGIPVNLNLGSTGGFLASINLSHNQGKGDVEGTINVNSKFDVGGNYKVEAG